MAVVWAAGAREVTARAVADELDRFAYTTIATVMNRLSRKGVLHRRMEGHVTQFTAAESPADRAAAAMRDALAGAGDPGATLRRFAELLEPAELEAFREAVSRST